MPIKNRSNLCLSVCLSLLSKAEYHLMRTKLEDSFVPIYIEKACLACESLFKILLLLKLELRLSVPDEKMKLLQPRGRLFFSSRFPWASLSFFAYLFPLTDRYMGISIYLSSRSFFSFYWPWFAARVYSGWQYWQHSDHHNTDRRLVVTSKIVVLLPWRLLPTGFE